MGKRSKVVSEKGKKQQSIIFIQESDKLNRTEYHDLELLLLYCKKKNRSCQPESRRSFCINKPDDESASSSFCMLFKIDRQEENDPLILDGRRPDYLVLYKTPDKCLATIIEMKGRDMADGVEQIVALHQLLKAWFAKHLPGAWKIHIQAIILGAANAQIPEKSIENVKKSGLHIFPLRYEKRFELFDYISEDMSRDAKRFRNYSHREFDKVADQFTYLETIFKDYALRVPHQSEYCTEHRTPKKDREGIYLNYLNGEAGEVLIFHTTPKELRVIAPESCKAKIAEELDKIKLPKVCIA